MQHWLSTAFIAAVLGHLAVQWWLSRRQVRHVLARKHDVPMAFEGSVSPADHLKAAEYTAARQRFGRLEAALDTVLLFAMTLGGGVAALGHLVASTGLPLLWQGTAHVLLVFLVLGVVSLPFAAWRTFVLEARFGFNRTTPATFLSDLLKSVVLGGVLGGTAAALVLWVMSATGRFWWIIGWAVWMAFSLILLWAWPRWIASWFNKFVPLADDALRERIDALLDRCGFRASAIFVMDGSRRSAHGNAYFTGLGREKRIVFFDTLLQSLSPPQVEAVLAHELAHFKLRHIPQRLVVGALTSFAGFALLGWLSSRDDFYRALGVDVPSDASALLLFMLVLPAFTWVVTPLMAAWSRRHEYEADAFAASQSDGRELARALVTMYQENASTLTPDPVHSAFYDSHPPPVARIARLEAAAARLGAGALPGGPTPSLGA